MERLAGVTVGGELRELRRLLYCGEWIESHVLHIGFLHAPDFLGYHSGIAIAADFPEMIESVLRLKKTGNLVVEVLGGRPIHPVNVRNGGFYRVPSRKELDKLVQPLEEARETCIDLIRWTAGFDFPVLEQDYEFVSLRHPKEYPFNEGRIVSNRGLDIDVSEFEHHSREEQVSHSTALHSRLTSGGWYHVGPLARFANNFDLLSDAAKELASEVGLAGPVRNPFKSIVVRGIETFYAIDEALRIINNYRVPAEPYVEVPNTAGIGWAATEAPRGLLYHRYETDEHGLITSAKIVPPTAQNQPTIESDLRDFVSDHLHLNLEDLERRCEQTIRNYDPCISCSTHFLRVTIERE
jgi:coenzyme F420-reducing hydrogenase alpha subunit